MGIGVSLFLIAAGAILKWAVTGHVNGVNLSAIGIILMVVGAAGLLITIAWMTSRRRTDVIEHGPYGARGTTYVRPNDPIERPY
jgi:hypothetical protein